MSKYKLDKLAQIVENSNYIMTQEEVCERLNDLEAKLAEKDKQIKELEMAFELCYAKMLYITKEYTNLSAIPSKEHFKQQAKEMLGNE